MKSALPPPHYKKLPREFYLQPTLRVARKLIGKYLIRTIGRTQLIGRIVEVEAYLGSADPASHAFNGRTRRNDVMFWQGGHMYVYFTYGMHFCSNVVTEAEGVGHAVLLRAVEPIAGLSVMARNRSLSLNSEAGRRELCSGPAKLCEAFGIARGENATDLCGNEIWIAEDTAEKKRHAVLTSSRVGITRGCEHAWRFYARENPFVSRGKPSINNS
ncbi:MAG: DNA-3-methyladenine glycosylase [Ignavibacteriae bacterium]|nr:DNA-3-methyladenine glycosylase [Ignavibacteriota bacterium]